MELSKTFDSKAAEERWFQLWIDRGYFTADPAKPGPAFSIVIPPPNVTGQLHLGHALNVTLQDIIVRTRRMQGFNTLWVPGTDHAGIATQNAVEKDLAKEGKNRHQLGRDKFEEKVWEWRETYGNRILNQLRRLGASCDWSRERFTLDEGLSRAVNEVFIRLFQQGLIYKDRRLINWCPRCETALSDLEVDHKDRTGTLWYLKYPLVDGSGYIEVATTRPETMLGDTAVAVNPEDNRYRAMVGKNVRIPLIGREIPIIEDSEVDSAFGTGAVKITPAHDFNDFEMGRRHQLAQISVLDTRARMNENAGAYQGLDRETARKRILADLKTAGLYEREDKHTNAVGTCSRCDTIVEPMLSEQWFLNVKGMAQKAIDAVKDGRTRFFPKFWENTFFNWMENIHDWCISRQLWWGHRIPAYRCQRCDHLMVVAVRPPKCEECEGTDLVQDDDVLDTWFSSGLWPFSTLGWPEETKDLARYYPTSLLVTGFDIIFFWVARMMMFGLEFTGDVPFRDIYITPLVRDAEGKKMSKSKGNVVDPLELMDTYGTDALRFTLAQLAIQGRDVILSPERLAASRAFANKIWNAARFTMMKIGELPQPIAMPVISDLELADRWILAKLDKTIRDVTLKLTSPSDVYFEGGYEFNSAASILYKFIWNDFCDWYLELSKERLESDLWKSRVANVLVFCLDNTLRLLHPFMPFLTEEIWQVLKPHLPQSTAAHLPIARYPESGLFLLRPSDELAMNHCVEAAENLNSLRALLGFHPGARAEVRLIPAATTKNLAETITSEEFDSWTRYAQIMARISFFEFSNELPRTNDWITLPLKWCQLSIKAPEDFDIAKARSTLTKKLLDSLDHYLLQRTRLDNQSFLAKADQETKDKIFEKAAELESTLGKHSSQLRILLKN